MEIIRKNVWQIMALATIMAISLVWLFMGPTHQTFGNISERMPACTTSSSETVSLFNGTNLTIGAPSSATSTVTYMTAGRATTTLACDLDGGEGGALANGAILNVLLSGSSTASILNVDIQYSENGVDWFASSLGWSIAEEGTASTSPSLGGVRQYTFTFASSTINRFAVTNVNSATSSRVVNLETPTRFIRAVFTVPVASAGLAFWSEIVGRKERN